MANWDISIFKNFVIYERFRAQFRAEGLNAFNTPYFRSPNGAFGSSSFGQVNSQGISRALYNWLFDCIFRSHAG